MIQYTRIVDLTHFIYSGMPVYPGDQPEPFIKTSTILKEPEIQITTSIFHLGTHFGTHIDAPRHFFLDHAGLDEIPLDNFVGEALSLRAEIGKSNQIGLNPGQKEKIKNYHPVWILFHTGWSDRWESDEYFDRHPFLSPETSAYLVESGVQGVGIDTPSVDSVNADLENYPVHQMLLSEDCLIVENLCGLHQLPDEVFAFIALPLKLLNVEAAPCRAIALL